MNHLQDKNYYIELYDKRTIEECLRWEKNFRAERRKKRDRHPSDPIMANVMMYYIKGERYRYKEETIQRWMERDRQRDEKLASAQEPVHIRCLGCGSFMDCTEKDLHEDLDSEGRVLFIFKCPKCGKHRMYWDNGEEWQPKPVPCSECNTHMTSAHSRKGNVVTTTYTCPNCDHTETDTLDLDEKVKEETIDPNFEADRKKYCLSDKEGLAYIIQADSLKRLGEELKEKEDHKEAYETLAKIKKLAIADLKSMLLPRLKKAGYWKLDFGPPEMRRGVTVPFTLQDQTTGRTNYDSISTLTRLLNKSLDDTNWRLTSGSVSYQLGLLNGRLKGIEDEHALLEQVKRKIVNKNKAKKKNRTTNKTRLKPPN